MLLQSHNKCKDFVLNKKCLIHSMSRIQSQDHTTAIYEIRKIFFFSDFCTLVPKYIFVIF